MRQFKQVNKGKMCCFILGKQRELDKTRISNVLKTKLAHTEGLTVFFAFSVSFGNHKFYK